MIFAQILKLNTKTNGFVLVFPQADRYVPLYMKLPSGMDPEVHEKDRLKYLLNIRKSFYGLKMHVSDGITS